MKFRIGNHIFLGGDSPYHIESPISGLTAPAIRTADGVYAGVDGGYVSSQLYGFRTITINGFYVGETCEHADNLRLALVNELHIRYLYPVLIETFSNKHYFTEAYIADVKSDITHYKSGRFQITLVCPDPIIYDGGNGLSPDSAIMQQRFYKEKPGGFFPNDKVPFQWTAGQMATEIKNTGSVESFPVIILRGQFKNPTVTNLTTNKFIKLIKTTTNSDEIRIDIKKRIITLNGVTIASDRTLDSTWFSLKPGSNLIVLTSDQSGDESFGTIMWKNGWEGI